MCGHGLFHRTQEHIPPLFSVYFIKVELAMSLLLFSILPPGILHVVVFPQVTWVPVIPYRFVVRESWCLDKTPQLCASTGVEQRKMRGKKRNKPDLAEWMYAPNSPQHE